MDEIDLKLLRLLQKNARTPIKALAGEVRLSSPAVSARIERLEKQGVIRAYTLDLDPLQLGHHILAYIHLDMQPTQKEEFYPFIAACSNVLECNCVTGNYSMLIKVSFASTQELDGFIGRLQKFGKTETQIVFSSPVPPRAIVVREKACVCRLFSFIHRAGIGLMNGFHSGNFRLRSEPNSPTRRSAQEGRHQGFHPLVNHPFPISHGGN